MKRQIIIGLIIVLALGLVGCNQNLTEMETEIPINNEPVISQVAEFKQETDAGITVEKQVLIDNPERGLKIVADSYNDSSYYGSGINITVINNSPQDIVITAESESVNNYMMNSTTYVEVLAGSTVTDTIEFKEEDLASVGIKDSIAVIELKFRVRDSKYDDIWMSDYVQIKTSLYNTYEDVYGNTGEVLFTSGRGVKIVNKGISEGDPDWGPEYRIYIENPSTSNITVQVRNEAIDEQPVRVIFSCDVPAGKKAIGRLIVVQDSIDELMIDTENPFGFDSLDVMLHIFDMDTYEDLYETDFLSLRALTYVDLLRSDIGQEEILEQSEEIE